MKVRGAEQAVEEHAKTWWERSRVIVTAVSTIAIVLIATLKLSVQLGALETVVVSTNAHVFELVRELKQTRTDVATLTERVGRLETYTDTQRESIRLFWSKDWNDLTARVHELEDQLRAKAQPSWTVPTQPHIPSPMHPR